MKVTGSGVGLKPAHYSAILSDPLGVDWFEAISENYMDSYGRALRMLERVRALRPVGLHGVTMSLGSADGISTTHLGKLAELVSRIEPVSVSDHLCFTSVGGHSSHDLLPMPMNEEGVAILAANIRSVQDRLKRRILVENVSSYVRTPLDTMDERDFVRETVEQADCLLLLDVNNVIVNAHNHGFDPRKFVDAMPHGRVAEIHLAGHSVRDDYLFDDHLGPTPQTVWDLLDYTLAKTGPVNLLVEWDSELPPYETLAAEAQRAKAHLTGAAA